MDSDLRSNQPLRVRLTTHCRGKTVVFMRLWQCDGVHRRRRHCQAKIQECFWQDQTPMRRLRQRARSLSKAQNCKVCRNVSLVQRNLSFLTECRPVATRPARSHSRVHYVLAAGYVRAVHAKHLAYHAIRKVSSHSTSPARFFVHHRHDAAGDRVRRRACQPGAALFFQPVRHFKTLFSYKRRQL